jgi:hypothetical protein
VAIAGPMRIGFNVLTPLFGWCRRYGSGSIAYCVGMAYGSNFSVGRLDMIRCLGQDRLAIENEQRRTTCLQIRSNAELYRLLRVGIEGF